MLNWKENKKEMIIFMNDINLNVKTYNHEIHYLQDLSTLEDIINESTSTSKLLKG